MGYIFAILVALAIFGTNQCHAQNTCPTAQNSSCDMSTLACCDKNFRTSLNILNQCENSGTFADPFCYRRIIETMYAEGGIQGLLKVCSAFHLFKDCLGDMMVDCMTYPYFIVLGYPRDLAFRTQVLYAQLQFACGAGMDSFIYNENCMPKTWNSSIPALEACRNEFALSEPNDRCYAMTNFLDCVQLPFQQGCTLESSWWMCEYTRVTAQIFYPECRGKCLINNVNFQKAAASN
jgi:hypothetical protein|uniref:Uncharacterized protein n=1 Tax=Panagrolaimus sp. PS1159 TaxID=55785 RepID=A0AC35FT11_9BILA